jgi:hypothetical protein
MKRFSSSMLSFALACTLLILAACQYNMKSKEEKNAAHYLSFSRFTNPKEYSSMLKKLPNDVIGICEIAKQQSVHHNLLPYFKIPKSKWDNMNRIWPPYMYDQLKALKDTEPFNLYENRPVEQRLIGACMSESHFLAGLLRYKKIPARLRAGYFKDISSNKEHFFEFWMNVARVKGWASSLLNDPEKWKENITAFLNRQLSANHYIEHWVCEYWDKSEKKWRILDANDTFLKASSGIEVGFHLPKKHFEYAYEAWKKMRSDKNFNPDQYFEEPQDGRSHIRSQLLWDFFSLLNHDLAGYSTPKRSTYQFVKQKKYEDTSKEELEELDKLADLLSREPTRDELVAFYKSSKTLKLEAAEKDPYSFVYPNMVEGG